MAPGAIPVNLQLEAAAAPALRNGPSSAVSFERTLSSAPRLDYLDGIRGAAAAMVVVNHFPSFVGVPAFVSAAGLGNPWVAIFITLSGFCLYLPAARREHIEMPRPFREFIRRRGLRIIPAWYASLALCVAVGWFFAAAGHHQEFQFIPQDWWDVATHLTLTHSMTGYSGSISGPGYTLGTEWQLYLLMLPFLWIVRRWGWLALLALVVLLALPYPGLVGKLVEKVFSPTFTFPFVVGMLAARLVYRWPSRRLARFSAVLTPSWPLLGTGIVAGIAGYLVIDRYYHDVACWAAAIATASGCIWMARYPASAGARVFGSKVGRGMGSFAYSLYLTHFPLLALAAYAAGALGVAPEWSFYLVILPALPLVFGFAFAFYLIFERPFLAYRTAAYPRRT